MWPDIDFSQFGAFAIVCVLLFFVSGLLYREWKSEQTKREASEAKLLAYVLENEAKNSITSDKILTLTGQVYDILTRNPNGGK